LTTDTLGILQAAQRICSIGIAPIAQRSEASPGIGLGDWVELESCETPKLRCMVVNAAIQTASGAEAGFPVHLVD